MRKRIGLVVAGVLLLVVGSAPAGAGAQGSSKVGMRREPARVVAAFYPLAWAAEQVGGDRVAVTNLTPAGGEPHDLELTTRQRDAIDDADLVLVLGKGFQPAVEQAASTRSGGT